LKPDYCGALNNLGRAHFHRGDPRAARAYFERALECNPAIPGARDYLARIEQER
jgi:Tfp pilus assembly protein PilF